jgi:hypothetical protein
MQENPVIYRKPGQAANPSHPSPGSVDTLQHGLRPMRYYRNDQPMSFL